MTVLLVAGAISIAVILAAVGAATGAPWLGLTLATSTRTSEAVRIERAEGAAAGLAGQRLVSVGGVALQPTDAIDEPDFLIDYVAVDAFLARQTLLSRALAKPAVAVVAADTAGRTRRVEVAPTRRPLASLPAVFWAQLGFAVGSFLIAVWVWSMRPGELAPRLFALTGVGMLMSATSAAVYSTRALALDGDLFRLLSAFNHAGPMLFGYAMTGLFLSYPRRLISPKWLLVCAPAPILWFAADAAHIIPDSNWGAFAPLLLHTLVIFVAVVLQWRATRDDPVGRAALRWFGISVLACALACIATMVLPSIAGQKPLVSQGYAFGFFFLIYVGLAAGLRRSRIFQLDEWAFRIAFYAGAGVLLIALDTVLVLLLRTSQTASLGLALLAVAFLYLPLREWFWRRLVLRRAVSEADLFAAVVDIALAVQPHERAERWRALLSRLYEPLQIETADGGGAAARILEDGLVLALPATGVSPPLRLRGPWSGRGLFSAAHLRLAEKAIEMVARTETRRDDYERGVAEERLRIAQDLHDDVGALLLSGLHKPDLADTRRLIRDAIFDVRMLASELGGERRAVGDLLADLRHESLERLEAAGLAVRWAPAEAYMPGLLDFAVYKAVRSSVRELVSNVIRHAGAREVTVVVAADAAGVRIEIADDGCGLGARKTSGGMGLTGVARRMAAVSGSLELPPQPRGARAVLAFPTPEPA